MNGAGPPGQKEESAPAKKRSQKTDRQNYPSREESLSTTDLSRTADDALVAPATTKGGEMTTQPRSTKDGAFCWQTKAARRLIRQKLPTNKIASALGIYDALTEIASDKESASFDATQSYIGLYAGVSGKTVQRISPDLEELALIAIKPNHIGGRNAECTWTVLTLGHYVRTPGHGRKQPYCPTIEEHKKNPQKNGREESPRERDSGEKKPKPKLFPREIEAKREAIKEEIAAIKKDDHNYVYLSVSEGGKQLKPDVNEKVKHLRRRDEQLRKDLCA